MRKIKSISVFPISNEPYALEGADAEMAERAINRAIANGGEWAQFINSIGYVWQRVSDISAVVVEEIDEQFEQLKEELQGDTE